MTTLLTRIGGYRVAIRPALVEEKWDLHESIRQFNFMEPDVSQAHVGVFMDEDGNEQSDALPYELRGKVQSVSADSILGILAQHFDNLRDRLDWTVDSHNYFYAGCRVNCTCEQCSMAEAIFVRMHMSERKNLLG